MRWLAPVRAGDTVAYSTRVESVRKTRRPEWGVVSSRNFGHNQHGAEVFVFTSAVLWERRA
jgi:acyl dehydratase